MEHNEHPTDTPVVEWAPFTLADGATASELMAASDVMQQEFLERQPGYVRRELLRSADGSWCDLVVWSSEQAAHAAMDVAMQHPACGQYFRLLAGIGGADIGAGVRHFRVERTY